MSKSIYLQVGKRIQELRRKKGVTQEKLALDAGLNRAYIGYIERGERSPSVLTLFRIARSLKIKLYELFI